MASSKYLSLLLVKWGTKLKLVIMVVLVILRSLHFTHGSQIVLDGVSTIWASVYPFGKHGQLQNVITRPLLAESIYSLKLWICKAKAA